MTRVSFEVAYYNIEQTYIGLNLRSAEKWWMVCGTYTVKEGDYEAYYDPEYMPPGSKHIVFRLDDYEGVPSWGLDMMDDMVCFDNVKEAVQFADECRERSPQYAPVSAVNMGDYFRVSRHRVGEIQRFNPTRKTGADFLRAMIP